LRVLLIAIAWLQLRAAVLIRRASRLLDCVDSLPLKAQLAGEITCLGRKQNKAGLLSFSRISFHTSLFWPKLRPKLRFARRGEGGEGGGLITN
jgi:hypothetical protein